MTNTETTINPAAASTKPTRLPRLGFLGVGWIGRQRMESIGRSGVAEVAAVADSAPEVAAKAAENFENAEVSDNLASLLKLDLDGVVIATPSALHVEQTAAALNRGCAVFCQKPLGRNKAEVDSAIEAASQRDRLLGVDLSYRFVNAICKVRELCASGELGQIYCADLIFHNAYGPDKPWFYDRRFSGGGCVMDLGVHLVDLALWILGWPEVRHVGSRLFAQGKPLTESESSAVEDYGLLQIDLENRATVRIACSWKLPAGRDAIIEGTFYGSEGGAAFHNVGGSFYHFEAERYWGTRRELLVAADPEEDWGGRAAVDWAMRLAQSGRFDPEIKHLSVVAGVLDQAYEVQV